MLPKIVFFTVLFQQSWFTVLAHQAPDPGALEAGIVEQNQGIILQEELNDIEEQEQQQEIDLQNILAQTTIREGINSETLLQVAVNLYIYDFSIRNLEMIVSQYIENVLHKSESPETLFEKKKKIIKYIIDLINIKESLGNFLSPSYCQRLDNVFKRLVSGKPRKINSILFLNRYAEYHRRKDALARVFHQINAFVAQPFSASFDIGDARLQEEILYTELFLVSLAVNFHCDSRGWNDLQAIKKAEIYIKKMANKIKKAVLTCDTLLIRGCSAVASKDVVERGNQCSICYLEPEAREEDEQWIKHCESYYHENCLNKWLSSGQKNAWSCPNCRTDFLSEPKKPLSPSTEMQVVQSSCCFGL